MHGNGGESAPQNARSLACSIWYPPLVHYLKCNVDSAFFTDLKLVGFGMCIRDETGRYVKGRTRTLHGTMAVREGEVLGLVDALRWVRSIGYQRAIFEVDAKCILDSLKDGRSNRSEYGSIVSSCRNLLGPGSTYE